jgi:hypothetical protein
MSTLSVVNSANALLTAAIRIPSRECGSRRREPLGPDSMSILDMIQIGFRSPASPDIDIGIGDAGF